MTDHKAEAIARVESLNDWHGEEGMTDATMISTSILAQVHATLYLAEQQRIANLIQIGAFLKDAPSETGMFTTKAVDAIAQAIKGLGL